jgi:hypothetical protein
LKIAREATGLGDSAAFLARHLEEDWLYNTGTSTSLPNNDSLEYS